MLEFGIVAARFLQFVAGMIAFGVPCFRLYGMNADATASRVLRGWIVAACVVAIAGAFVWFWLTIQLVGCDDNAFAIFPRLPAIALSTSFGHIILARLAIVAALLLATMCARSRAGWTLASLLGAAYVASLAWTGHAVDDEGTAGIVHMGGDIVHLLSAALWLGTLPPLLFLLNAAWRRPQAAELKAAHDGLAQFSAVGPAIVAILLLTGVANAWFLVGTNIPAALRTPYGLVLLFKIALAVGMLALAANNRYRLTPALQVSMATATESREALMALQRSVGLETALAVVVLAAVSLLGTLPPTGAQ